jgi:hypothetical protein
MKNLAAAIVNEVWQKSPDNTNIHNVIKIARLAKNMHDVDVVSRVIFS